ncbi:MAG: hypothetical protein AUJ56_10220 [Zetaproteobacteria bacterium CG1_02_49_23]|nr:MAG: hypothetical protein AUJ56_10220 [Zetaproteobacteria bacterium CG1_02_49_23]
MNVIRLLLLLALLAACQATPEPKLHGYLEADYIDIATQVSGRLLSIATRGSHADPDAELFMLDEQPEALQIPQLQAESEANLANQQAASASLKLSQLELYRLQKMNDKQFASTNQRDQARLAVEKAEAALHALQANSRAIDARMAQVDWALQQKRLQAPVAASIEDVFFEAGEWVPAGKPVLRLLPDDGLKLRFYVPENERSSLIIGQTVQCLIDGITEQIEAKVSFIADEAEFAPPIIYSEDVRSKLVYRVEARLLGNHHNGLHPGQPVDVLLP